MPLTECRYRMFCKWKHVVYTLSSPASFSRHDTVHTQPVVVCFSILFLSVAKLCLCMNFFCMDVPQGIYPPLVDRHLDCFQFGGVMNLYTINFYIHVYVYFFRGWIPISGIAGCYSKCVFSFVRNCQTIYQSGCTVWRPRQPRVRVQLFCLQHFRFSFFKLWGESASSH